MFLIKKITSMNILKNLFIVSSLFLLLSSSYGDIDNEGDEDIIEGNTDENNFYFINK